MADETRRLAHIDVASLHVVAGGLGSLGATDELGGDLACWAHLVCLECGMMLVDVEAAHDCATRG